MESVFSVGPLVASYSPAWATPRDRRVGFGALLPRQAKCRARCYLHRGPMVAHARNALLERIAADKRGGK